MGEVATPELDDVVPRNLSRIAGRFSQFAVAAAKLAQHDAGLSPETVQPDRLKVCFATSMSGLSDVHQNNFAAFLNGKDIPAWASLEFPAQAAALHVASATGARGQLFTLSTACAAGLDVVGWSVGEIRRGRASAVIAGATETPLSSATMAAFHSTGVLARWDGPPSAASRPFDRLRSGLVMAEGAAAIVIEDPGVAQARRARIYGRVLGFASQVAHGNPRQIDETGEAAASAMEMALESASLPAEAIDYVSAHGNSMIDYDVAETRGLKLLFGRRAWNIPTSSLKSMCGQALSASGAMQVVAACLTIRDQLLHPTINYTYPDPVCDLDYVPNIARRARVRHVLVHAHGIGGSHSALVIGAPE